MPRKKPVEPPATPPRTLHTPQHIDWETPTLCVLLDAGHGGSDPGLCWSDDGTDSIHMEKDITLAVVERIVGALKVAPHVRVRLSRHKDDFVNLRCRAVNPYHVDLLVSIHVASSDDPLINGPFAYISSVKDKRLAEIATPFLTAAAAGLRRPLASNPVRSSPAERLLSIAETNRDKYGCSPSVIRRAPKNPNYGAFEKGTPAVILCLGYITNADDRAAMLDPRLQDDLAREIARVIVEMAPPPEKELPTIRPVLEKQDFADDDLDHLPKKDEA